MFIVRRWRAFRVRPYSWTIHIECQAPKLDADGKAEGVDFDLFWHWIADHLYDGVEDETGTPIETGTSPLTGLKSLGMEIAAQPEKYTAERMAFLLRDAFRELSPALRSVRVIRDTMTARPYSAHECLAIVSEAEHVTRHELVTAVKAHDEALVERVETAARHAAMFAPRF